MTGQPHNIWVYLSGILYTWKPSYNESEYYICRQSPAHRPKHSQCIDKVRTMRGASHMGIWTCELGLNEECNHFVLLCLGLCQSHCAIIQDGQLPDTSRQELWPTEERDKRFAVCYSSTCHLSALQQEAISLHDLSAINITSDWFSRFIIMVILCVFALY